MPKRKPKPQPDIRPVNFLAVADDLGLTVVSYLHESIECNDGVSRWLPRDLIGRDGKSLIVFRSADREYSINGWCPWHDGMFGGRCQTISSALHWIKTAKGVRAGTIADFRGA
jgi:hypothetical protein